MSARIRDARPINKSSDPQYFPALTGLRFLLALWVVLHHITGTNMMLEPFLLTWPAFAREIIRGGYLAVQSFFLLSGFVLAQSYATARWNRTPLARFGIARFARIYPAYFFSLILIVPFMIETFWKRHLSASQQLDLVGNYTFVLQGWTGAMGVGWNTPAWSLSCEFFFYLCFPLLFLWFRDGKAWKTLPVLAVSFVTPMILLRTGMPDAWKPILHLSDFVAGIAASNIFGMLQRHTPWLRRRGHWLYLPALAGGIAVIVHPEFLRGTPANMNTLLRPLNVLALVGLALGGGFCARMLSAERAQYLGKISYSMYILHVPLLWWYSRVMLDSVGDHFHIATSLLYLGVVVAAAAAVYQRVEDPANRAIRGRVSAWLRPAALKAAA